MISLLQGHKQSVTIATAVHPIGHLGVLMNLDLFNSPTGEHDFQTLT